MVVQYPERTPKYYGYYSHKNGFPIVIENFNDSVKKELIEGGYWKNARALETENQVISFFKYYNAGFGTKRFRLKPIPPCKTT